MRTELHFVSPIPGGVWIFAITVAVSTVVAAVSFRRGAQRGAIVQRILTVWFVASLVGVALLTLQPGPSGFDDPLPSIFNPISPVSTGDAIANTMLYVPVGLFAALLWRTKPRVVAFATGLAFAVSLTIELAQRVFPIERAATAHDVIFNTLGGFIGAVVGSLLVDAIRRNRPSVPRDRGGRHSALN